MDSEEVDLHERLKGLSSEEAELLERLKGLAFGVKVFLAKLEAISEKKYQIDYEECWSYMAQKVGMSVEEVKKYWEEGITSSNYTASVSDGDAGAPSKGEEKEEKTEHKEDATSS